VAWEVTDVATLLEKHGIKRVPIIKDDEIVGIVSRANLLWALAALKSISPGTSDDASIRAKLKAELANEQWTKPSLLNLIVHGGTVDLWGSLSTCEPVSVGGIEICRETVCASQRPGGIFAPAICQHRLRRP
jgi:predicted transcriptional regulator